MPAPSAATAGSLAYCNPSAKRQSTTTLIFGFPSRSLHPPPETGDPELHYSGVEEQRIAASGGTLGMGMGDGHK